MRSNFFPLQPARSPFFTRYMEFQEQNITRRTFVRVLVGLTMTGVGSGFVACRSSPVPASSTPPRLFRKRDILFSYSGHINSVYAVAWSPDGLHIASGGDDKTVQVWDALGGTHESTYVHSNVVTSVAWSPDGAYIASGTDDSWVYVWNTMTGKPVSILGNRGHVWGLKWSPDGKYIASGGDDTVRVWNMQNGDLKPQYGEYRGHRRFVWGLSWSPDGKRIASGGEDKTVQVWNVEDRHLTVTCKLHSDTVHGIDWSPDGNYIASVGYDGKLFIWEAANGRSVFSGSHEDDVYGVTWSPDGKYVTSSSRDRLVKVWDFNKKSIAVSYDGQAGPVFRTVWSPESKRLASGYRDSTAQVWELPNL